MNGIVITSDERKGAEIDYLKKYGVQWAAVAKPVDILNRKPVWDIFFQTHPRYALLLDSKYYLSRPYKVIIGLVRIFDFPGTCNYKPPVNMQHLH